MKEELKKILVEDIQVGERFRKDYGDINDLVVDINLRGLISPIAVLKMKDGKFLLLAGGRRLKAWKESRFAEDPIPARVFSGLTKKEARGIELAENIKRKNLSPSEELELKAEIHKLMCEEAGIKSPDNPDGWSVTATANMLGEKPSTTSEDLDLADVLEAFPELKNAKSKAEIRRAATFLIKQFKASKAKESFDSSSKGRDDAKKEFLINSFVVGEFLDIDTFEPKGSLKVKDESIDLVECDPPYGISLKDIKHSNEKVKTKSYEEVPEEVYSTFLDSLIKEIWRVMKKDSWLIFWFAPEPWFEVIFQKLKDAGFSVRRLPLIWVKDRGQTNQPKKYLASTYEMAFYAAKGNPTIFKQHTSTFVYRTIPATDKFHITQKPISLYVDLLSTFVGPGSNILVPFAGSGNSLLAAQEISCSCLGFDIDRRLKDLFSERVINNDLGDYSKLDYLSVRKEEQDG